MKKIRIMMTVAAFAVAVAGAVTSSALTPPPPDIYAYEPGGSCFKAEGAQLPSGCSNSSGTQVCTMYFEEYGEQVIYSIRMGGDCGIPFMRW